LTEKAKNEDCEYVSEKVCAARMMALEKEFKYLFGTSILTIALIIVQLVRGL